MTIIKGNIGNALHSVAPDHIVATADSIFDENLGQYQSEINQSAGGAGAFDISEYNKSGDTPATYATLAAALAVVPSAQRKGGMSVKFIDSTTSKYVQYRLTATAWSTTTADWQGVDDEPRVGSANLVKSGGVYSVKEKAYLNSGFVGNTYVFDQIKADTTAGTRGRIRKYVPNIGYNEYFKFRVTAADGLTLNSNSISLYIIASNDSTYSIKENLSLDEEFTWVSQGFGIQGFAIQTTAANVITNGNMTLEITNLKGDIYSYFHKKNPYYLNFANSVLPTITESSGTFNITIPATDMELRHYGSLSPILHTFSEQTEFSVGHYDGLYWNLYTDEISVLRTSSQAAAGTHIICLFANSNGVGYGLLASNYTYALTGTLKSLSTTLQTDVEALQSRVYSSDVPNYYVSNVNQAIGKVKTNMADVGKTGESFVFITDIHWDRNTKNSPSLIREILSKTNVKDVLCTGDLINEGEKSEMATALIECSKAFEFDSHPLITTRGNHDDNSNWASSEIAAHEFTFNQYYSYFLKPMEGLITYIGTNAASFYYDKIETKTRYIFLDSGRNGVVGGGTGAIRNAANLLNTTDTGWKVIFIQHFPTGTGMNAIKAMVDGCNARDSAKVIPSYGITMDYSNAKCECVAIFAGHTHVDGSATTDGGVPIIITDTDCGARTAQTDYPFVAGTVTEQCFDVVTIDYTNRTIKCVRVGRGIDRTFSY